MFIFSHNFLTLLSLACHTGSGSCSKATWVTSHSCSKYNIWIKYKSWCQHLAYMVITTGALDKYNIFISTFSTKDEIFISLEVLALVNDCMLIFPFWVLVYLTFKEIWIFLAFSIFQSRLQLTHNTEAIWSTLGMILFTKDYINWKCMYGVSWRVWYWFTLMFCPIPLKGLVQGLHSFLCY